MSKLASCLALVAMFQLGCRDLSDPDTDTQLPDIGDGEAVSVDTTSPEAPNPTPPDDPLVSFIATHQADSRNLIAHQGVLYWIDEGTGGSQLRGVSIDNGSWGVLTKLNESPFDIVALGNFIYASSPFAQSIDRVDLTTGEITQYLALTAAPLGLATDREALFATTTDGRVLRITDNPKPGRRDPVVEVLTTISDTPITLAVRDQDVFFGTAGGALHRTLTIADAGSEKITSQHGFAGGLAMDDTYVYWASDIERIMYRMDRFGGDPEPLIEQLYGLSGVATDGGFVYVTSRGDNAVRRFASNSMEDTLEVVGTTFRAPADPIVVGGEMFFVSEDAAAIGKLLVYP